MRIGISILTHAGQNIWENGLGQNVFFLARLLRALPFVTDVVLLNCGDQTSVAANAQDGGQPLRLIPMREATECIDVAIEMGGGLDVEWLDYLRARGKRVVFFCCGQPYVGLIEPSVFKRSGYFTRANRCDAIWILSKDRDFAPMLRTLHRCPVIEVPYLWDPVFVEQRAAEIERAGLHFGYQARQEHERGLRVAIFEPNISVVKNCAIPLLVCEAAARAEPESVSRVHVLNSVQMQRHPTFEFLTRSLELARDNKLQLDQRHDFVGYMSQFANAVVSHQWHNDQNILYLDALYGDYPLIHNAPWIAELGYYYPDSDIEQGASQLVSAASDHDDQLSHYRHRSRAFLSALSSQTRANRIAYAQCLLHLVGRTAQEGAR
ncbi:DUF2827 domain-containing protein [Burkholderia sp. SIMBA_043]|uniref:DUF2827 domain-containing protein n=2 Tax=Pseudomonadati TaxID=3379134 RepID=A0A1B4LHN5_9BURK|nr:MULTISPECIES: DUF2827 domain-containing protein [Burkholderia cepacia complex]AJY08762.1 hypothetical protein AK36_5639 [Burkholderia vietnamiensis LMG 10929]AOJ76683.1 hypothetical protein WJ35_16480 [Burkholderia ubonensis]AOK13771.1 hypothetical protein WK31_25935 [Burkholderia vietnamiensis]AVR14862.1 DUF2827 domain-containing protein [Burkholderia vietnamiensis]KVE66876.1 hypothetical protein WI96_10630 [Burkholderia vietnamiensis]